jgi:hypothetical protein
VGRKRCRPKPENANRQKRTGSHTWLTDMTMGSPPPKDHWHRASGFPTSGRCVSGRTLASFRSRVSKPEDLRDIGVTAEGHRRVLLDANSHFPGVLARR